MPWIILTLVTLLQKQLFISANDIVVAIRLAFISLYSIQGLKTQHKHRVLPLHRIEMDWDNISRPFGDRGFDWMVILCKHEFLLMRLSQDPSNPPRVVTLGRDSDETGHTWFSGLVTEDAALALYSDWTAKIITYSWGVEMTDCVFRMKHTRIPEVTSCPRWLFNIGLVDMSSERLVFIDRDQNCVFLNTVPSVSSIDNALL